jgi:hypothetical protein
LLVKERTGFIWLINIFGIEFLLWENSTITVSDGFSDNMQILKTLILKAP